MEEYEYKIIFIKTRDNDIFNDDFELEFRKKINDVR